MFTVKQFCFGVMLSIIAMIGVILVLLPAIGISSGAVGSVGVVFGIALTVVAVILECWYNYTTQLPCLTGIIITTILLTYVFLTLLR